MCPSPRLQSLSNYLLLSLYPSVYDHSNLSTWTFSNALMQATRYSKPDLCVTPTSLTFAVKRSTGSISQPKNLFVLEFLALRAMSTDKPCTLYSHSQVWRAKLRYRPIVTGACFPSSIYHKPLPRMINQPTKLSQMIRWRYEAHAQRIRRHQAYIEIVSDLKLECRAEDALLKNKTPHPSKDTVFGVHCNDWSMYPHSREFPAH